MSSRVILPKSCSVHPGGRHKSAIPSCVLGNLLPRCLLPSSIPYPASCPTHASDLATDFPVLHPLYPFPNWPPGSCPSWLTTSSVLYFPLLPSKAPCICRQLRNCLLAGLDPQDLLSHDRPVRAQNSSITCFKDWAESSIISSRHSSHAFPRHGGEEPWGWEHRPQDRPCGCWPWPWHHPRSPVAVCRLLGAHSTFLQVCGDNRVEVISSVLGTERSVSHGHHHSLWDAVSLLFSC